MKKRITGPLVSPNECLLATLNEISLGTPNERPPTQIKRGRPPKQKPRYLNFLFAI